MVFSFSSVAYAVRDKDLKIFHPVKIPFYLAYPSTFEGPQGDTCDVEYITQFLCWIVNFSKKMNFYESIEEGIIAVRGSKTMPEILEKFQNIVRLVVRNSNVCNDFRKLKNKKGCNCSINKTCIVCKSLCPVCRSVIRGFNGTELNFEQADSFVFELINVLLEKGRIEIEGGDLANWPSKEKMMDKQRKKPTEGQSDKLDIYYIPSNFDLPLDSKILAQYIADPNGFDADPLGDVKIWGVESRWKKEMKDENKVPQKPSPEINIEKESKADFVEQSYDWYIIKNFGRRTKQTLRGVFLSKEELEELKILYPDPPKLSSRIEADFGPSTRLEEKTENHSWGEFARALKRLFLNDY
jgi:hypothetical protein